MPNQYTDRLSNLDHLKSRLYGLNDDPSRHWSEYPCLEWDRGVSTDGYGGVLAREIGELRAHRVAYVVAYGKIPEGMLVCHHCDNRLCFRPIHLFAGTVRDNVHDMIAKGRKTNVVAKGERASKAKLTVDQVLEIRDLHNSGLTSRAIGARFSISHSAVLAIVHRTNWAHL